MSSAFQRMMEKGFAQISSSKVVPCDANGAVIPKVNLQNRNSFTMTNYAGIFGIALKIQMVPYCVLKMALRSTDR